MKYQKTIAIFFLLALTMSVVSAGDIVPTRPTTMTVDQFKDLVIQANNRGALAAGSGGYWGICERTCTDFPFRGDCNACGSGETASSCLISADSMSSSSSKWSSGSAYCNDFLKPYNYYNKQCFCNTPSPQCSGGGDPGDRKCQGDSVFQCSNSGTWDFVKDCDYGCSGGSCESNPCQSHTEERCSGSDVYWYNSCGQREEMSVDCRSDEKCESAQCVRQCTPGLIGAPSCNGNNVVQQYQNADCSTTEQIVQPCSGNSICQDGQCIDTSCNCGTPTQWSNCVEGVMTRTAYQCDATNHYTCQPKQETQSCECGVDNQCQDTEYCSNSVCTPVECDADQVVSQHQCVDKKNVGWLWIVYIVIPLLIGIGIIIYLKRRKKR